MKRSFIRLLSVISSFAVIVSFSACTNSTEAGKREVKLSQPSQVSQESQETVEEEPLADPESFVILSKLDTLPDHMTNNKTLYAKLLEGMLKLYYTGLVNGKINSDTISFRFAKDVLPDKALDAAARKKEAGYCKVGGALEYFGYDRRNFLKYYELYNGCLPYFCNSREGRIYLSSEVNADTLLALNGFDEPLHFIFRYSRIEDIERDAMQFAANETDSAVKAYYEGIKSGKINKDTFKQRFTHDVLPEAGSSAEECEALAAHATIGGALEYADLYTPLSVFADSLGFNKRSEIFTLPDFNNPDIISIKSLSTEISSLYK